MNEPDNEPMVDVVWRGVHSYWSTHCRHHNHEACRAICTCHDSTVDAP